jgi:drug/metabolite transporter (DMT)-like permease
MPRFTLVDSASLWMLVGAVLFATMGAGAHALGTRCDWLLVALARSSVMFLVMAGWARVSGVRLVVWRPATLWQRSLAGSVSLVCNFYVLAKLPVSEALTISNTFPLWIVVLTALQIRHLPPVAEVLGVVCGLAGVLLIERPDLGGDRLAVGLALAGSFWTALALLGLHRLREIDTRAVVAHFAGVSSLVALVGLLMRPSVLGAELFEPATLALLGVVVVTGTAGQYCLTRAYTGGSPARMAVVGLSQVVFALGFDMVIWGRSLTPLMLVGFVLVLGPSAWLNARTRGQELEAEPGCEGPSRAAGGRLRVGTGKASVSGRS